MRYLLDTNVLSEPLKPQPSAEVIAKLERYADEVATASIVWHELVFGIAALPAGKRRAFAERFLRNVITPNIPVLAYDAASGEWHAHERARLAAAGKTPPFADGQIASITAVNGLTLVTANIRDFAAFRELRVVSWHV